LIERGVHDAPDPDSEAGETDDRQGAGSPVPIRPPPAVLRPFACTHRVGATVAEARRIAMDSPPSIGPRTVRLAGCYGRCHGTTSVEGKRGHRQRQRGQLHQQQQVVITGYPVESKATAVRTAMDEDPPALPANGDGDRLHPAGTVGTPITGGVAIEVPRPEAGRAMIAMGCARRVVGYGYATARALEGA